MTDFIHSREYLNDGDIVVVDCDTQCNVMLLTDTEFSSYRRGQRFNYYGGHYSRFPARIAAPSSGYWNVVIDIGGARASIRYSIGVIKI
jgi:hypothetical protein